MDNTLGKNLIELRIASRNACNFEQGKGSAVTLRIKALYLLSLKPCTPPELMEKLCMVKSNLALLCNKMVKDGVIVKVKNSDDRRVICYHITEKGDKELGTILHKIEEKFKGTFSSDAEYEKGVEKFNDLLDLLSFI